MTSIDPVRQTEINAAIIRRDLKRRIRQLEPTLANLVLSDISTADLAALRDVLEKYNPDLTKITRRKLDARFIK